MFLITFFSPYKYIFDTHIQNHYNNRSNKISFIYENASLLLCIDAAVVIQLCDTTQAEYVKIFCLIFQMKFILKGDLVTSIYCLYFFLYREHAFL